MNNKQPYSQQRSSSRISTEKIFCFILLVSVSCFQLALHYSSIDIRRIHDGDNGNDANNDLHDGGEKSMTAAALRSGVPAGFNHRLANGSVCLNIKSTRNAAASMQPKININIEGQRFIASGGYEAIAKGSGPIHAAGPIVNLISKIQHSELHIFGTVAEVGVHHGRFTSFLFITARVNEKLVVVDLFEEQQDKNVDMSGLGDYKQFVKGMNLYGLQVSDVFKVYKGSTDQIPFDWADKDGFEPFRLVSIDAGHTADLTFNDLQLAFCNLLKGGVVIIDDWYVPYVLRVQHAFCTILVTIVKSLLCLTRVLATLSFYSHQIRYHRLSSLCFQVPPTVAWCRGRLL
jgi:Methyltransferase domain